jgi:hypothetical protein
MVELVALLEVMLLEAEGLLCLVVVVPRPPQRGGGRTGTQQRTAVHATCVASERTDHDYVDVQPAADHVDPDLIAGRSFSFMGAQNRT